MESLGILEMGMLNRLKYARCYLCGAMDRVADAGVVWRENIRRELDDLGVFWLDPTCKPINVGIEDDESRVMRKLHKAQKDYDYVRKEMHKIRRVDLRMVDVTDFLVVNLDIDIHACGTYEEIFLANSQKKPIYVRCEQGKQSIPDWMFGVLPHEYCFSTWDEVYEELRRVAFSPDFVDLNGRWYFFNWMGS